MAWDYEQKRESQAQWERNRVAAGQEIGTIPPIANQVRRRKAIKSFEFFCSTYFPASFTLPWSDYHRKAASKIEAAVANGGMFAFAMPRGSGKTTICEWAALWAMLTGKSPYVVLIGASEKSAERRLQNIRTQLATNDLLLKDFPCECYPIRKLERSARRCEGQKYKGKPTFIEWKAKRLTLPWIPEKHALGSGACVDVLGITGEIRGLNHTKPDGSVQRPTFAICDDPQTRESARSPSQSQERERTMAADIAYLAGPGSPIAVVMPCTVIYEGDMADNLLNREKHPEYQGERTAMVQKFPANEKLWDEYADILHASLRADGDASAATAFYRERQQEMDEGAVVSWPERHNPDELSGVQHAMNLKIRDEAAFWSECQNEPLKEAADLEIPAPDDIATKISGYDQRAIPASADVLTAFIDVQGALLYWVVAAWQSDFSGWIVDYGSYPQQARRYFTLRDARKKLKTVHKGCDDEAAIYAGMNVLFNQILGKAYRRDDGAAVKVQRCLVDANWGGTSQLVKDICRQSKFANILSPSYGRGIKASQKPIDMWSEARSRRCGPAWAPQKAQGSQLVGVVYDTNYWKKRLMEGLAMPLGSRGTIALYKALPQQHRMIADHLTAEVPQLTISGNRSVYEWQLKPGRDNHLLDCCVGSMVAASMCGVLSPGQRKTQKRRRVSYAS